MKTIKVAGVDDRGFAHRRDLDDGRMITVEPLVFGQGKLGISRQDSGGYDDFWDFPSLARAIAEAERWNPDTEKEPTGWHRHQPTGRYRTDGDPAHEYTNER